MAARWRPEFWKFAERVAAWIQSQLAACAGAAISCKYGERPWPRVSLKKVKPDDESLLVFAITHPSDWTKVLAVRKNYLKMSGFNPALMSNKFEVSGLPTTSAVDGFFGGAGATGHFSHFSDVTPCYHFFCEAPNTKSFYKNSKLRASSKVH